MAGMIAAFSCSIGNAQLNYSDSLAAATLIYSNAFDGGAVDINGTAPTYINPIASSFGGTTSALFDVLTNSASDGFYAYQDGTLGPKLNSVLLPFAPVSGYVYTLSATLTFTVVPPAGGWGGLGFATRFPPSNSGVADPRLGSSSVGGNPWALLNMYANGGGAILYANGANQGSLANLMNALNTPYTINLVVDTTGSNWITALYINGTYVKEYTYSSHPNLLSFGYTQTTTTAGAYKWGPLTLSASPLVITKQPNSASVAAGTAFTNTVVVAAVNPAYQWFNNGIPIPGATNSSLIFNPAIVTDTSTNYYVVVTNSLGGSATSSVVSLTVYSAPTVFAAYPMTYTNVMTLYGGTNVSGTSYLGSSPTFLVSVIGQEPLYYQWQTNGVPVSGATNTSFTFSNCPLNGPISFACVVTNVGGATTNTWLASYLPTPIAPFPATILSYNPIGFWRLNEGPDDGNGDNGTICNDYQGGNNGIYTNVILGYQGYTNTDPTDASVRFNYYDIHSDVFGIQGVDFSNRTNACFSVQAWVNGSASQPNGACILAKGYNGGEQFALDVNGGKYRFLVRNGAGIASSVTAPTGPDNNWHFIVGVCDEINGYVSLYVDGLTVGSASIASGSGVFPCATPVTIGARGSSAADTDSLGFYGYLSDLAIYKQALSAGQVADLWITAGYSVASSFVPPLPPTNYVFQANGTITIPVTFFGSAPMGYYWTNLTTGEIVGAGQTNVTGNLDATLIITNASASLSGDQLELVVTNATTTTNWFVSLFSPPPPVTLDYSSPILYSNYFNGGTWSINGMPLTAVNALAGGTNATWNVVSNNPAAGYAAYGNGTLGPMLNSVLVPFKAHSGYIYTLSASLTFTVTPPAGGWGGLGFSSQFPTNYVVDPRVLNNWALLNMYANGGGANLIANSVNRGSMPNLMTALNTPYDIKIVLDTTGVQWSVALYVADTFVTNYVYSAGNPSIASFGYTQTTTTGGAFKWNYIALTQESPSGAPPYLLDPLPPASLTVGAGTSLSIPVSAFGSVPMGYYWSNTNAATVLVSGTTNNVAPLNAGLSVPNVPSSWNGNTLSLVVTNAYGTNISFVSLIVTNVVNINPTNIVFSSTGNQLTLIWPMDHTGWTLQAQTNTLAGGIGTNWVDVPNSSLTNQVTIPVNPNNGSVFYRLFYQP